MEYGLRIEAPERLPGDAREACAASWASALPSGPLTALYFGTEFCEHRLPGAREAASLCRFAAEAGLDAVLLTPIVTDQGAQHIERLLDALARGGHRPAVVFNDWGVLGLLREAYPEHPRRAGRLLNRGLRDPRAGLQAHGARGDRAARVRRRLAAMGAQALETDPDRDGGYLGEGEEGLGRALHLPYAFATTGRNCLLREPSGEGAGPGITGELGSPCSRPCRSGPRRVRREDTESPLWRAGNAIFYEVSRELAEAHLQAADRVVIHRRPAP